MSKAAHAKPKAPDVIAAAINMIERAEGDVMTARQILQLHHARPQIAELDEIRMGLEKCLEKLAQRSK